MRIAIPLKQKDFSLNFSNCDQFALIDIKTGTRQILNTKYVTPPSFNIKILPGWIQENEVDLILAGGMPAQAQNLFADNHIEVRVGFLNGSIKEVIETFIESQLNPGFTTVITKK